MTILLHTIIALTIFISTIISGNPNIVCSLTFDNKTCKKQVIEKPKGCSGCKKEQPPIKACNPTKSQKQADCGIFTAVKLKTCCQCSTTRPLQSAILHELKPSSHQKQITQLNTNSINTSNRYNIHFSNKVIPYGIHHTISSTIMLL